MHVCACEIGEDEKSFLLDSLQDPRPHNDIQRKELTTENKPRVITQIKMQESYWP